MSLRGATRAVLGFVMCAYAATAAAQTQVKPRFLFIIDTSGSMLWTPQAVTTGNPNWPEGFFTHGDGSYEHPGCDVNGDGLYNDSKIYQAKQSVYNVVSSYGEVDFALERFDQTEFGATCTTDPDAANYIYCITDPVGTRRAMYCPPVCSNGTDYIECNGTPCGAGYADVNSSCQGHNSPFAGNPPIHCANITNTRNTFQSCIYYQGTCTGGDVLVPFSTTANTENAVLAWVNNHEFDFAGGTDKELRANGATPLDGSLATARDYLISTVVADPIIPKDTKRACRSYNIILLTDGQETCAGTPAARATELYSQIRCQPATQNCCYTGGTCTAANGYTEQVHVKVYTVGFSLCSDGTTTCQAALDLNAIAVAGGTTSAYFVGNQTQLEATLADIIAGSIPVEKCNGLDDDCNGLTDEAWPTKGAACTVGRGLCANSGTQICAPASVDPSHMSLCCGTGDPNGAGTCLAPGTGTGEICDGLDNNCNGVTDEGFDVGAACDNGLKGACFRTGVKVCSADHSTTVCNAPVIAPQTETCNGIDDNCNGTTDESDPSVGHACTSLPGNTGTGTCKAGTWACVSPNLVCQGEVGPATEVCDGKDNNCNGLTDEYWPEKNLACSVGVGACQRTGVYICSPVDNTRTCCGDATLGTCLTAGTAQTEVCDGVDNNCNGQVDESDPHGLGTACTTIPGNTGLGVCKAGVWICQQNTGGGATLVCFGEVGPGPERCNGLDNNCDGVLDSNDPLVGTPCGYPAQGLCQPGAFACVAHTLVCQGGVGPQPEKCDGIDNDCDGQTDEDYPLKGTPCSAGIGACAASGVFVCNAAQTGVECNAVAGTGHAETCNGVDDNCNGVTDEHPTSDEGGPCYAAPDGTPFAAGCDVGTAVCLGTCRLGATICESPNLVCEGAVGPVAELCNGLDDDCDGLTDEDFPGLGQPCDNGELGICYTTGVLSCNRTGDGLACNAPPGVPHQEICNGLDDDCDGQTDEDLTQEGRTCGSTVGECKPGTWHCSGAGGWVCSAGSLPQPEICDGKDNNCNGIIDDNPIDAGQACYTQRDGTPYTQGCDAATGTCAGTCKLGHTVCETAALVCEGAVGPVPEICNGLDDDCDGLTDNNATCAQVGCICYKAECRCPCSASEFPCPANQTCFDLSGGGAGVPCAHPGDANCFCIPSKCAGKTCPTGQQCDEASGDCVDPCAGVACQSWEQCQNGQCYNCQTYGCAGGERCAASTCGGANCWTCVADPCAGKTCPTGQFCNSQGACQAQCDSSTCGQCQKCGATGVCEDDPCCDKICPQGQFCDPSDATCKADPCLSINCQNGFVCDKAAGACVADPCTLVTCNTCQTCQTNLGVNPATAQCVQSSDPSCQAAPHTTVTAQGGGCSAAGRMPAWPWLGLALLGLGLRRRRGARGGRP